MTSTLHTLDATGDSRVEWDPNNPVEVEIARKAFEKLKDKKYRIYRTDSRGNQGEIMRTFDPSAERIIAAPQTVGG